MLFVFDWWLWRYWLLVDGFPRGVPVRRSVRFRPPTHRRQESAKLHHGASCHHGGGRLPPAAIARRVKPALLVTVACWPAGWDSRRRWQGEATGDWLPPLVCFFVLAAGRGGCRSHQNKKAAWQIVARCQRWFFASQTAASGETTTVAAGAAGWCWLAGCWRLVSRLFR